MIFGNVLALLVLRDSERLTATIREALASAPPEERAGLERALELAGQVPHVTEADLRTAWVRRQLASAGFTGPLGSVESVRALRGTEPRLGLAQAVELLKEAAAEDSAEAAR
ncbi:hypothetical protein ACFWU3_15810 [Streptomyces sp. NPDC058685]|uniref:hypothetical protein n=1 Tax=Streptomyces sp. NPDC058685 TaxID=3346598 RepID=UPI0036670AA5